VDVPLCIFSSSSASILYQFHANTHITPVPAGIHATFDYPVISTYPHKGSGTGQSIQRDSNDVVHYSGKMMKNKLHLWADNTTDPAIEYIMIEAQEMTHDWYGYDVYVTIR
jgi:hypothetical protein